MTMINAWLYLLFAILAEVIATTCMKLSDGFANLIPASFIFIFYGMSLIFLTFSLKRFEISFAYAIWSAIGTILIFLIGVNYFHESVSYFKIISLSLIIIGVAGLKQE